EGVAHAPQQFAILIQIAIHNRNRDLRQSFTVPSDRCKSCNTTDFESFEISCLWDSVKYLFLKACQFRYVDRPPKFHLLFAKIAKTVQGWIKSTSLANQKLS